MDQLKTDVCTILTVGNKMEAFEYQKIYRVILSCTAREEMSQFEAPVCMKGHNSRT